MFLLTKLTGLLPARLQPYAKACWPAIGTAAAVAAQYIASGKIDKAELVTAATGAIGALLTLAVPNKA